MIVTQLDRIQKIISEGYATIVSEKYCSEFDEYLCNHYPWMPITASKIDWSSVSTPYKRFQWSGSTKEEMENFLKETCINKFDKFCIIYGANQPGILVEREFAYKNFAILTIFGWAVRFVVGVQRDKYGIIMLDHSCFIEVDFGDWLTASC